MKLSDELVARGFIYQYSADNISEILDGEKRTIYHGIDPSADSAHAGNFVVWMLLRHLVASGHKVIFLVGGGTGMIGDPKPDSERELKEESHIDANVSSIKAQAEKLIGQGTGITFVNNKSWLGELGLLTFLRDIGKHFTVNELIKKDAISKRVNSDNGISYTEFAYPLLQGYDYLVLHRDFGCTVQVGGSDQWGNIIAGVDLIRRKTGQTAFAITVPLIVDKATGKKFGKSEGNAVWLDPLKTSPYAFYQFWLNTTDINVSDYLKLFTLFSLEDLEGIINDHNKNPNERIAQKHLASSVTTFVHGKETTEAVIRVSEVLFEGADIKSLNEIEKELLCENAPTFNIKDSMNIVDILVESGLASSKREAREFIDNNAITLGVEKIITSDFSVVLKKGDLNTVRRGKKHYIVLVGV